MGIIPIILLTLIGLGILAAARFPKAEQTSPVALIGLAFWVGVVASTIALIIPAVLTGRFFFIIFYLLLAVSVALIAIFRSHLLALFEFKNFNRPNRNQILILICVIPFVALMAFNVLEGIKVGTSYGFSAFDTIGNFAMKAKLWHETGQLRPDQLRDPEFLMYKRSYPPIVPAMEMLWARVLGEWNDVAMKWFFLWCWVSAGTLIYGLIRQRTSALGAAIGACFWFSIPMKIAYAFGGAISGYADVPLALAFLAAVFVLQTCRQSKQWGVIALMAVMAGCVFWVKKEGLPFAALLIAWMVWARIAWQTIAATLGIWSALFIIYKLTIWGIPTPFEDDMGFNHAPEEFKKRLTEIWKLIGAELSNDSHWGKKLWWVLGFAWIFKLAAKPWRQWLSMELFLFWAMAAVYIAVLILTHYPFHMNLDWVFERLFVHILPLLIVATFSHFDLSAPASIDQTADKPA